MHGCGGLRALRPGLDAKLNDANRRKFDIVMAWAIDRLGTIQQLEAVGVDLYLDQQHIDTTTPQGKLLFQITGAFAEFERGMIVLRVNAGLGVVKAKLAKDGKFTSKAGIVRSKLIDRAPSPRSWPRRARSSPKASASARWPGSWCIGSSARYRPPGEHGRLPGKLRARSGPRARAHAWARTREKPVHPRRL